MTQVIFKGTPVLETERLLLRKLTLKDVTDVFAFTSDEIVIRYLMLDCHRTVDDTRQYIMRILNKYENDTAGEWAIVLKENDKVIGSIGFPWHDPKHNRAEIVYMLGRPHWGLGIMPEALTRILKFAFEDMSLNRIECGHLLDNEKSGKVMLKVGMKVEGVIRERYYFKNRYWDIKQYAILRSDWENKT